ncbi:response regulator transcription factor [Anaerolineae bacterium CFX7]|nr:response regulator transcription factor [Anaerolineae bacterium CFX7]
MDTLTPSEKEIVILVAQGYKNREIAEKLSLAEQTVRNYLSAIYAKTGSKNRVGLTIFAMRTRWIDSAREK